MITQYTGSIRIHLTAAVVALSAAGSAASGSIMTFTWSGTIDAVAGDFSSTQFDGISVGDTWTWTISFETSTPDLLAGDPSIGFYDNALTASTLTIGSGVTDELDPPSVPTSTQNIVVFQDTDFPGFGISDQYTIDASFEGTAFDAQLTLTDTDAAAFASDALPTARPDPADFEDRRFLFFGPNGSMEGTVAVPAPGAATVLLLAAAFGRRRRSD